ncbi:hypothetical protein TWF281_002712 [Arthrobotrys megalospora]
MAPEKRRPIGSATARRIFARQYRRYGTPPPRPNFGGLHTNENSKLQGLDWNKLPDIKPPRKTRRPPSQSTVTPKSMANDGNSGSAPTSQIARPQSPNILYDGYDSDDTLDAFAHHAAASPTALVHYRAIMRRRMKKRSGACGNALHSGHSLSVSVGI